MRRRLWCRWIAWRLRRWHARLRRLGEKQCPLSISPSLKRDVPPTQGGGMGYVSAGQLLWRDACEGVIETTVK